VEHPDVASRTRIVRRSSGARWRLHPLAGFGLGLLLTVCNEDAERLEPVKSCTSHDDCTEADERYDRCAWVCEGQITYCIVSCETAADCRGRGLPDEWIYCDIPRPGDGFCNWYGADFEDDSCKAEVPEIPE